MSVQLQSKLPQWRCDALLAFFLLDIGDLLMNLERK
jgi:hypothetical protein